MPDRGCSGPRGPAANTGGIRKGPGGSERRETVPKHRSYSSTLPKCFGFLCQTITIAWYALHGDPAADVRRRRLHAPWYPTKRDPSMLDILASLRRELIRTEYHAQAGRRPIPDQTSRPPLPQIAATG